MGSANPKPTEAPRWVATEENQTTAAAAKTQSVEDHNPQLYLGTAVQKKRPGGSEEHRSRMQNLLQRKRSGSILQATEAVEIWECNGREYGQRFVKNLDEDVKIGVILALAPPQALKNCHLNSQILKSYAKVRTMLFDYCPAQADTAACDAVPMDLSVLGNRRRQQRRKTKGKGKKGKGKGKDNAKATEYFAGYCLLC